MSIAHNNVEEGIARGTGADKESDCQVGFLSASSSILHGEGIRESRIKKAKIVHAPCEAKENHLKLVGDMALNAMWEYPLKDDKRRSFAGYLPGALPKSIADKFFETINKETPWVRGARSSTAWVVKPPCTCAYQYTTLSDTPLSMPGVKPSAWPDWMDEVLGHVMPLCGFSEAEMWPNSCNINHYEDGWEGVGWHADDEVLFQGARKDCLIISLTLGQARLFCLSPLAAWEQQWPADDIPPEGWDLDDSFDEISFKLGHGDLCTMEGMLQKHYRHAAPPDYEEGLKPRLNLTWRWIVQHEKSCSLSHR